MAGPDVIAHPSPNFGARRDGLTPTMIVIHFTAMQSAEAALARLCDPEAEVSAHYLISNRAETYQLVAEDQRAWHAGRGSWRGLDDINSRSIGIELDNTGRHPFSHPQMTALESLMEGIMDRWGIPPAGVIGHSDMAPGRKVDPGPHFDWGRLVRQGLAPPTVQRPPERVSSQSFREAAIQAGYPAEAEDAELLQAVRLRNRPQATGPLCAADFAFAEGAEGAG